MPGFSIAGTGGETRFGGRPNSLAEVRRTHRWTFETLSSLDAPVFVVLQTASRPNLSFDEPEMHHNQEKVYFAGKHTWEPIELKWYDVEQDPDVSSAMWTWLNQCLIVTDMNVNLPNVYKAREANLNMVDGMGTPTERWRIFNGWPQKLDWADLDYTNSELQLIEVTYRYDRAVREQ